MMGMCWMGMGYIRYGFEWLGGFMLIHFGTLLGWVERTY